MGQGGHRLLPQLVCPLPQLARLVPGLLGFGIARAVHLAFLVRVAAPAPAPGLSSPVHG